MLERVSLQSGRWHGGWWTHPRKLMRMFRVSECVFPGLLAGSSWYLLRAFSQYVDFLVPMDACLSCWGGRRAGPIGLSK